MILQLFQRLLISAAMLCIFSVAVVAQNEAVTITTATDNLIEDASLSLDPATDISIPVYRMTDAQNNDYFTLYPFDSIPSTTSTFEQHELLERQAVSWLVDNYYGAHEALESVDKKTQYAMTQLAIWHYIVPDVLPYDSDIVQNNSALKTLINLASTNSTPAIELEAVSASMQAQDVSNETGIRYDLQVNAVKPSSAIDVSYNDFTVSLVEANGTATDITSNPNVAVTFDRTSGKGTLQLQEAYYHSLPAASRLQITGAVQFQASHSPFLTYQRKSGSLETIVGPHKQLQSKTISVATDIPVTQTININGQITWDDEQNRDSLRPSSVTIKLLANNTVIQQLNTTAAQNWTYSFPSLPKYDENNAAITYTLQSDALEHYLSTWNSWNVTNTLRSEEVLFFVDAVWDDGENELQTRPNEIDAQILANGEVLETITLSKQGDWYVMRGGLPVYKNGELIQYTIQALTEVPDYTHETTSTDPYSHTIIYRYDYDKFFDTQSSDSGVDGIAGVSNDKQSPLSAVLPQTSGTINRLLSFAGFLTVLAIIVLAILRRNPSIKLRK